MTQISRIGESVDQADAVAGAILGCAVGDAIGLPYEALSRRRGVRLLGPPTRHRFLLGRGMVSDDTEHSCMVAQAFCEAPTDPDRFARHLARRLRWWLLGVPAGIGTATLRATLKLWLGFPPTRSGVFSAGNGPAMRTGVLGALIDDLHTLALFVRSATVLTHTDPKAYYGALAVAVATWCARRGLDTSAAFLGTLRGIENLPTEFDDLLAKIQGSISTGEPTGTFAAGIGCHRGVSSYVYRTVPVVLHAWLSHPRDFRRVVTEVIECGGDTDTSAAIAGAIVGSGVGRAGIPKEWLHGLWEWPRSVSWMEGLAEAAARAAQKSDSIAPPGVMPVIGLVRNAVFVGAVLTHVGRRLLPPY